MNPVIEHIGNTPLVRLHSFSTPEVSVFAKLEMANPTGSLKDRIALAMIQRAEAGGSLAKDKTIIEASSGNTGISLCMVGSMLGYKVRIFMPESKSIERRIMMRMWGGEVVLTSRDNPNSHIEAAAELAEHDPDRFYYINQNGNEINPLAHAEGTGAEILRQHGGNIDYFVMGFGTGGTLMGVSRKFKERGCNARIVSVQPATAISKIEGLLKLGAGFTPGIYDPALIDEHMDIDDHEAIEAARQIALREGFFAGISSGANLAAAMKCASRLSHGTVVTVLCDRGERYLSTALCEHAKEER